MDRRAAGFVGALGLLVAGPWAALRAAPLGPDPVVLRVGQREMRRSDLEARLRTVPHYQLRTFGSTDSEAIRQLTETVVAREALLDAAGEAPEVRRLPEVAWAIRRTLADALVVALDREARAMLKEGEIEQHFDAHRDEYRSPQRLLLWRIVVSQREEAQAIIAKVQGGNGVADWEELARNSSEDHANHLRGGNLGFVEPSGQTEWPELRVDPALYRAALAVPDGALVPEPIALAERFCVVWRRGSVPARGASFEGVRTELTRKLVAERRSRLLTSLLESLRKEYLSALNPSPIEQIPPTPLLDLGPDRGEQHLTKP